MPLAMLAAISWSRWAVTSASRSASCCLLRKGSDMRMADLCVLQNCGNGGGVTLPLGKFALHVLASFFGERVELGPSSGVGDSPLGSNPALFFETMEGGVERTLADLKDVAGNLLNAVGYGPAVRRLKGEDF